VPVAALTQAGKRIRFRRGVIVKKLLILFILTAIQTAASAALTFRVCEADGVTDFDYRDIMVGTKLTIITRSDSNVPWDCGIFVDLDYYLVGELTARGPYIEPNDSHPYADWSGSHFPAAGDVADVIDCQDSIHGFGFFCYCGTDPEPNDWYILDYSALDVGDCNLTIYDKQSTEPNFEPNSVISFHHVPTRDFYQPTVPDPNVDPIVNFADYAVLADWWQQNCGSPGGCDGADLDDSNDVDIEDLRLFCDYWLEKTE
jgi:hypothetical protein